MKKYFNYFVVCICVFWVSLFCDSTKGSNPSKEVTNMARISIRLARIEQTLQKQDTSVKVCQTQLDDFRSQIDKSSNSNDDGKILFLATIIAAILSIIAIVLSVMLILRGNGKKVKNVDEELLGQIKDLKNKYVDVKVRLNKVEAITKVQQSSDYLDYIADIQRLEGQVKQLEDKINLSQRVFANDKKGDNKQPETQECLKVCYAKNDAENYFTKLYDWNQEGCVFQIILTDETTGKFSLISLDKLQSRNDWQQKVECSGISIKDAKDFKMEEEGICEKIDENTWKVTKPLKIKLL